MKKKAAAPVKSVRRKPRARLWKDCGQIVARAENRCCLAEPEADFAGSVRSVLLLLSPPLLFLLERRFLRFVLLLLLLLLSKAPELD